MLFGVIFLMTAYLDNSATTPVCGEAVEAMKTAVTELWGNPSSLHQKGIGGGRNARKRALEYCAQALLPGR